MRPPPAPQSQQTLQRMNRTKLFDQTQTSLIPTSGQGAREPRPSIKNHTHQTAKPLITTSADQREGDQKWQTTLVFLSKKSPQATKPANLTGSVPTQIP